MTSNRRPLVALYAFGVVTVLAALFALTAMVQRQQAAHAHAVADALYHEDVRTALWRMETRLATLLALTTNRVALVQHPPGSYSSNWVDPLQNGLNPDEPPEAALQQRMVEAADQQYAMACTMLPNGEPALGNEAVSRTQPTPVPAWTNPSQLNIANRGQQRSADEFERRLGSNVASQVAVGNSEIGGQLEYCVGPLASVWEQTDEGLTLHFARRIQSVEGASHESYRLDWSELAALLLAEITDLFPTAQLVPIEAPDIDADAAGRALRLAAVPARLVVPPPQPAEDLPRGYVWTLVGAWSALVFALTVGGLALRSSYAYGDKHRRFTHAVTHELRTPLTTFRMYSEMLARGMVPPDSQPEYHATLESEATRLARLVDNVLRYARLEDGKHGPPRTEIGVDQLVERVVPELARTCANAGAQLEVEDLVERDVRLRTDAEAVLQILSNLVENACKYGRPVGDLIGGPSDDDAAEPSLVPIVLRVTSDERSVYLAVCDSGPGVALSVERAIFQPFDRGSRDSSDEAPGVGLGLALSKALATELGGTLTLVPSSRGATFRLVLPR